MVESSKRNVIIKNCFQFRNLKFCQFFSRCGKMFFCTRSHILSLSSFNDTCNKQPYKFDLSIYAVKLLIQAWNIQAKSLSTTEFIKFVAYGSKNSVSIKSLLQTPAYNNTKHDSHPNHSNVHRTNFQVTHPFFCHFSFNV